ncbi:EamA family transporter [Streptomyces zingiberis]|uniref:EamA family transporter n=1 Tax=Streptomyces zingiberis TaxID=2053010 RepID=A0ABX1C046_9ACTN|nr:EamA family transporter [Streptomyces zingiberis]NJQ03246.1 EamA family transporter [Streptomyces zingiberis]
MRESTAPALVLGSMLSVHFGLAVGKQLFDVVGPLGVMALRLGLAAVVLLLVHRPALPRTRADLLLVLGFGTAIAGMNLVYPALWYLPLGTVSALQLLGPVTLALLASRRTGDLLLASLAGLGVWLFHAPGGVRAPLPGVVLALASGVSMACYLLLSRRAGTRGGGAPLALAVTWAAVLTVPFGVAESGSALLDTRVLLTGALVAVLATALPYSLELAALRRLPPRTVGVLQSLEPVCAGIAGTTVLAEHLAPAQWLALGCVGTACAGTVLRGRRAGPGTAPGPAVAIPGPARPAATPDPIPGPPSAPPPGPAVTPQPTPQPEPGPGGG